MSVGLGTAHGKIVIDGSGAQRGFAQAAAGASKASKAMKVGFAGVAVAGVGFGAAMTSAVRVAASFEQELANLKSVARPTGQEFEALREQALKLGADTKFSAGEAAAAQVELAKGGLEASDILGGALPGALALAAAGDLELADAATISVNAMKQFGMAGSDVTKIADAMAVAANQTTADVGDFGQAMTQGAAMAQQAGWGFDDAMAALSALADAGVKGSDAGTSMKTSLQQLINPTEKQSKLARQLGINWIDQNGAMKDAEGISRELVRATKGMTQAERAKTFAILAGSDGFRTLSALYSAGPAGIRRYIAAQSEAGAAAEAAAIKQDTLEGKLENLGGAIETIKIRVGAALIPALSDAAVAAAEFLEQIGNSDEIKDFAANLASGLGDAASQIGDGLRVVVPIVADVVSQIVAMFERLWPQIQTLGAQIGSTLATALQAVPGIVQGALPVIETLASALLTVGSAAMSVAGPIVALVSAVSGIPGVAATATASLIGLGAAMGTLKAVQAAGGAIAFAQLATQVKSMSDAASLAGAAFPRLATGVAALTSPVGLAAVGIGALVGGLVLLASSKGPSITERLAQGMRDVARETDAARSAMSDFVNAINGVKDAQLAQRGAVLRLQAANIRLKEIRERLREADKGSDEHTALLRERTQAIHDQKVAEQELANAKQRTVDADEKATVQAAESAVAMARAATQTDRQGRMTAEATEAFTKAGKMIGLNSEQVNKLEADQQRLTNRGATLQERTTALVAAFREQAKGLNLNRESAQVLATTLDGLGQFTPAGIQKFGEVFQNLQKDGIPVMDAIQEAIEEVSKDRSLVLRAEDQVTPAAEKAGRAADKATGKPRTAKLGADDKVSPAAEKAISTVGRLRDPRTISLTAHDGVTPKAETARESVVFLPNSKNIPLTANDGVTPEANKAKGSVQGLPNGADIHLTATDEVTPAAREAAESTEAIKPPSITITAKDEATPKITRVADGVDKLRGKSITLSASAPGMGVIDEFIRKIGSIPSSKTTRLVTVPVHKKGSPTVYQTIDMINGLAANTTKRVTFQPSGSGLVEMALTFSETLEGSLDHLSRGFEALYAMRAGREKDLAAMELRHQREANAREMAAANKRIANAQRAFSKAEKDERAAARDALLEAKRARAQLLQDRRIARAEAAQLRPLQAKITEIEVAESALSDLESALGDVGGAITGALQRTFDRVLSELDQGLQQSLAGVEAGLERSLAAVESTLASTIAGIDSTLSAAIAGAEASHRATLDAIESSVEQQRVRIIDAALESARAARAARDEARRRSDLSESVETAQGELGEASSAVVRLQAAMARARTESERQAAEAMLREALAAEAEKRRALEQAQQELADFEEDLHWQRLETEREALQAGLEQRREAADQTLDQAKSAAEAQADQARAAAEAAAQASREHHEAEAQRWRDHHQRLYDDARAAAEREYVARQAEVQRQLGDLREQLRAGEITHTQALDRLQAIYDNPTIKASIAESGKALGLEFSRGLDRSKAAVERSSKALARIIRRYLKLNSPAETGPLRYDPMEPGRIIGESLARGMASQQALVERVSRDLAAAAATRISPSQMAAIEASRYASRYGAGSTVSTVTNTTHNVTQHMPLTAATPEDARSIAERLDWAARFAGGRF